MTTTRNHPRKMKAPAPGRPRGRPTHPKTSLARPRNAPRRPGEPLPNARHEKFATELAKGASATAAYKRAGYRGSRQHAARMVTNGDISERLAELKSAAAERAVVTTQRLIEQASELQDGAVSNGQYGPAVSALANKAKLAGLLPAPKSESLNLSRLTDAERAQFDRLHRIATGDTPRERIPSATSGMSLHELGELYARTCANPDAIIEEAP